MRLLPALALLLPACVWAGLAEYVTDGYEGASMGMDEVRLLSWYAVAICAYVAMRKVYAQALCAVQMRKVSAHECLQGLAYACAGVVFWRWPEVGGSVLFVAVTVLIVLLGVSRR